MNHRQVPFSSTVEELDNLLFKVVVASFNAMYPNDARMALKAAMHLCDKLAEEMEGIAAKQAKSAQARAAAQARYAGTPSPVVSEPLATPQSPVAAPFAPVSTPVKRHRRTKAQIAADEAAKAAAAAPVPVAMGQVYSTPFPATTVVTNTAPPPIAAPTPTEAPVVTDFAALAQQAASQGVPQFAPSAAPTFIPTPPPTFG